MKKILAFVLALTLIFVCSACNSDKNVSDQDKNSSDTSFISGIDASACTHIFLDATCQAPQTCTKCQVTQGEALEHTFADATCTTPQLCTVCKTTQGEALGHTYADATCVTPKKCTVCQAVQGKALGHALANATCKTPQICTRCKEIHSIEHTFKEATCQAPQTCAVCGIKQGSPADHNYVAGECTVCSDYNQSYCPKLYFTGNMTDMNSKKDVRDITVEYRSKNMVIKCAAKIKPQGTSSLSYAKKNYTINLFSDSQYTQELGINVGWGNQSEYCLKANWIDKTHSRNVVSAKIVGEIQKKYGLFMSAPNNGAVDGFPVEVYINGSFHGLYTMNIPKAAWMFNMDENNPNHIVLCGENWNDPVLFRAEPNLNDWSVEVGPENGETLAKFKRLTDFIRNSTDEEFKANFEQYLNLDATLNYYIMMYYGWLPDNAGKNMLLATYDGMVWYPALYDLDTSWGVDWMGNSIYNYKNGEINTEDNLLWERMKNLYSKEIAARYFELRSGILDEARVMNTFKSFYNSIPEEIIKRETEKWGPNIPGFDLSQIQDYLNTFIPRLDKKFDAWK